MTILRAQVTIPYTSGLPRDVSVNTWSMFAPSESENYEAMDLALGRFYTVPPTGETRSVTEYYSSAVRRASASASVHFYDIENPGPPLYGGPSFNPDTPLSATSLPLEVALCTTLVAGTPTDVPIRSRRGRIFLGPFIAGAVDSTYPPKPVSELLAIVAKATERLMEEITAIAGGLHRLVIWSPTRDNHYDVSGGWVDNEFDTQRRRQVDATARTEWGTEE